MENLPKRKPTRLKEFDYSQSGAYFVTIVTKGRTSLFGHIVDGEMNLSDAGKMIHQQWMALNKPFPFIQVDEFIAMPNHFHGILFIIEPDELKVQQQSRINPTKPDGTLGDVIGAFKSITTNQYIHGARQSGWKPFDGKLWQRSYYDRIIRDEDELNRARAYIINNPLKWELDRENPVNVK